MDRAAVMPFITSLGRRPCNAIEERAKAALKGRFIVNDSGCWCYTGSKGRDGYGLWRLSENKRIPAHRHAYLAAFGFIPSGYVVDHMCRNPQCVNPSHLRACTQRENVLAPWSQARAAAFARRDKCSKGHDYSSVNARGHRECVICQRERSRAKRQRWVMRGLTARGKTRASACHSLPV